MFESEYFDGHERVVHVYDEVTGLRAIIAMHSSALGPAAGGCRLWTYESSQDALSDALRLSRGMSYKNALAGLPMGGGKAVILGPLDPSRRAETFQAFGRTVDALGGAYITAEDVGVSVIDIRTVATETKFVSGLSAEGGAGGDPSPYTARGVRCGIEAAVMHRFRRTSLEGLTVAIQGLGGVGGNLARELHERGARLVVADIDSRKVESVCDRFGALPVNIKDILLQDVDIVAPCALGGAISEEVATCMSASVVAGGANNQIATPAAAEVLRQRGITYAPDYVINAGGIIMVAAEYFGKNDHEAVLTAVDAIYMRTFDLLKKAQKMSRFPGDVADEMARAVIAAERRWGVEHAGRRLSRQPDRRRP